jgi:meso-butanediol dehydrogenase / (S,S)-butanediol dehydrogenase / diacetyl reductase
VLLSDDVVLCAGVTGAVGTVTLSTLAREGARLAVVARSRESAQRAIDAQLAGEDRAQALVLVADLTDPQQAAVAVEACVGRFGRVDALVNLAGEGGTVPLVDSKLDDLRANLESFLITAYNLALPTLRAMLRQPFHPGALSRGHIVSVTAGSSLDPAPRRGLFGAAKAGVNTLMRAIAREHKGDGIVANAVVLGGVATDVSRQRRGAEAWNAAARPQEVADVLAFLASRRSSGINGALVELNAREVD